MLKYSNAAFPSTTTTTHNICIVSSCFFGNNNDSPTMIKLLGDPKALARLNNGQPLAAMSRNEKILLSFSHAASEKKAVKGVKCKKK